MRRIQGFIGVSDDFEPPNLGERYLVGRTQQGFQWGSPGTWMSPSSPFSPQGLQRAARSSSAARSLWHAVPFERQRRLRRPYERVVARVNRHNRRAEPNDVAANAVASEAALARLAEHYGEDRDRLTSLTGSPPPWSGAVPA